MGFTCVQITDDVTFITNEGGQPFPPPAIYQFLLRKKCQKIPENFLWMTFLRTTERYI